jgi:hypothetical protein
MRPWHSFIGCRCVGREKARKVQKMLSLEPCRWFETTFEFEFGPRVNICRTHGTLKTRHIYGRLIGSRFEATSQRSPHSAPRWPSSWAATSTNCARTDARLRTIVLILHNTFHEWCSFHCSIVVVVDEVRQVVRASSRG